MTLAVLGFLAGKLRIAAAKAVVGDVAINVLFMQVLHVGFVGKTSIGRDNRASLINIVSDTQLFIALLNRLQHRLQGVVFLTFAKGLGIDDDLVFFVHRGHAVITLYCAFAGGHFAAFVIGDVALHFLAPLPLAILGLLVFRKRSTLFIALSSDRMVLARRISRSSSASVSASSRA